MQGIHSSDKQQLNQTQSLINMHIYHKNLTKKPVLKFTHNGQALLENTH